MPIDDEEGDELTMSPDAKPNMNGTSSLPDPAEGLSDWSIFKQGVTVPSDGSNASCPKRAGISGASNQILGFAFFDSLGSLQYLALAKANFLKEGKPGYPAAKPFLVRGKRRCILGFAEETVIDIPWGRLDLALLLKGVLVCVAIRSRSLLATTHASSL